MSKEGINSFTMILHRAFGSNVHNAHTRLVAERIEYRDENGNILNEEQVKELEGRLSQVLSSTYWLREIHYNLGPPLRSKTPADNWYWGRTQAKYHSRQDTKRALESWMPTATNFSKEKSQRVRASPLPTRT